MQIVIDIDENLYTRLFDNRDIDAADMLKACVAIRKGTPLPKGHGAIVDLKQVIRVEIEEPHTGKKVVWNNNPKINDTTWHIVTPTIIEADKAESEKQI